MARPTALPEAFGRALRALRTQAGLTQEALANGADLTPRYIGQLESGRQSPTLVVVGALAAALGRRPSELLRAAEEHLGLE